MSKDPRDTRTPNFKKRRENYDKINWTKRNKKPKQEPNDA